MSKLDLRCRYLPALSGTVLTNAYTTWDIREKEKNPYGGNTGKPLTFWEDNSLTNPPLKYPYMLISAYFGMPLERGGKGTLREQMRLSRDGGFLLGDSGGFTIATKNADVNPLQVIDWENRNCDAGLILDVPPFKIGSPHDGSPGKIIPGDFEGSMKRTVKNTKIMMEHAEIPLYGVLQGSTPEQIERWYRAMKGFEFAGWAFAPKPPNDLDKIMMWLKFVKDNIMDKPIHVLQLGSPAAIIMLSRFSAKHFYNQSVTYDNSTPILIGSNFRQLTTCDGLDRQMVGSELLSGEAGAKAVDGSLEDMDNARPVSHKLKQISGTRKEGLAFIEEYLQPNRKLSCPCPVCAQVDFAAYQERGSVGVTYATLHNVYWYLDAQNDIRGKAQRDRSIRYLYRAGDEKEEGEVIIEYCHAIDDGTFDIDKGAGKTLLDSGFEVHAS